MWSLGLGWEFRVSRFGMGSLGLGFKDEGSVSRVWVVAFRVQTLHTTQSYDGI